KTRNSTIENHFCLKNIIDSTKEIAKKGSDKKEENNIYSTIIHSTRMVYSRAKHLAPIYINKRPFTLELDENSEIFNANIIKQKMEQVWIIILNNACDEFEKSTKNIEDRKIDIDISNENSKVVIKIKDNAGDGIPEHVLPNIFNPFASTKVNKGMGVGLNIAKQIVELHNGTIEAYNEDKCAIFCVEI
ncbi:MAG: HAMP domain-containing sensor histidine kinase, partial [Campylobacterota bacterium]|nr:HAMP domain-containing sensor histidine kinase [Campylobacterota bacterium]